MEVSSAVFETALPTWYIACMSMDVRIEQPSPGTAVVTITGAMNHGFSLNVANGQLRQLMDDGVKALVLDISGVPYVDSSGLGLIVLTGGLLHARGGAMRVAGTNPSVMELFTLTKTDGVLTLDPDPAASLAAIAADQA